MRREGGTEREPVRCGGCGELYRNPRMALLLSLVLPGLGSIYQGWWIWGGVVLLAGTAAFVWTVWRLGLHVLRAWSGAPGDLPRLIVEAALGIALVLLAYAVDLLVVWLRRHHLAPY